MSNHKQRNDQDNERKAYSVRDIIQMTGLGRNTVYRLIKEEKVATIRVGKRILIPRWALEAFLGNTSQI